MSAHQRSALEVTEVLYALEAMRQAKPLGKQHPLTQFLCFKPLQAHILPIEGNVATDVRIFRGLTHHISRRLDQHRKIHNMAGVNAAFDRNAVIAALRNDFRVENTELEAWSVLYHRFVRVDVDFSLGTMSREVQQTERTLNRRQHLGVARLTHDLIRREMRIRRNQHKALLRSNLINPYPPFMVGREGLLKQAVEYLSEATPAHLILCGLAGVGKSTFALALAHQLIDTLDLVGVVWIDRPCLSPEWIGEEIACQLHLPEGEYGLSLSAYCQSMDTLIVLDHAQAILDDPTIIAYLATMLGGARLVVCAEQVPETMGDMACLPLPDLDKEAALMLLERCARRLNIAHRENLIDVFDMITHECGGNPGALRKALLSNQYAARARLQV